MPGEGDGCGESNHPSEGASSSTASERPKQKPDGDAVAAGCGGALLLVIGLIFAMIAPAVGGLSGITDSPEDLTFAASDPIPLDAHRTVVFELGGFGADDDLQRCKVTGPGHFSYSEALATGSEKFRTKKQGNYFIACSGGAVTVHNDAGGDPAAAIQQQHGERTTNGLLVAGGVFALFGMLAFVASARLAANARNRAGGLKKVE